MVGFVFRNSQQNMMEKEIIICAAVKTKNRMIIRCHRHSDGLRKIKEMPYEEYIETPDSQGFITSKNRYVGRAEALKIQKEAGIETADRHGKYSKSGLFSEDLY